MNDSMRQEILDVFEAYAFLASLIQAVGYIEAQNWLSGTCDDVPRHRLLTDMAGRARLYREARPLLYTTPSVPHWQPAE